MSIERILQISLVIQMTLSSVLLCMGQEGFVFPCILLPTAIFAFYVIDVKQYIHFSRFALNIPTILASIYSGYEVFFSPATFEKVVAVANMLVYLELILLFRRKTVHVYWMLILLSFLQVVVGAAFRQNLVFGLVLSMYLISALVSLASLLYFRERQLVSDAEPGLSFYTRERSENLGRNTITPVSNGYRESFQMGTYIRRLGMLCLSSLFICTIVFFGSPRFGNSAFLGFSRLRGPKTGFSGTVRLGEVGPLKQNSQQVCRVQLLQEIDAPDIIDSNIPGYREAPGFKERIYPKTDLLYLRAVSLNTYDNSQWKYFNNSRYYDWGDDFSYHMARRRDQLIRVEYTLEPMSRPEVPMVWPSFPLSFPVHESLMFDKNRMRLLRNRESLGNQLRFSLGTHTLQRELQLEIAPVVVPQSLEELFEIPTDDDGKSLVPSAEAVAVKWLNQAGMSVEKDGYYKVAKYLERMLRDSGKYQYTLQNPSRQRSLDPIEDFLSVNPAGHCEYFSSALVMLLRSVRIPCQVALGYCTNEYNTFGGYFQVRQLHAHSWVEVYLPKSELPKTEEGDENILGSFSQYRDTWDSFDWRLGGWLRLDPTPSSSREDAEVNFIVDKMGNFLDWLNAMWSSYIIEMDAPRQQEQVYAPIAQRADRWLEKAFHISAWKRWLNKNLFWIYKNVRPHQIFAGLILVLVVIFLFRQLIRLGIFFYSISRFGPRSRRSRRASVRFYRQFEYRLSRLGYDRLPEQTPFQFARQVEIQFPESTAWDIRPTQMVQMYYQVRFGGESLTDQQLTEIQQQISRISRA